MSDDNLGEDVLVQLALAEWYRRNPHGRDPREQGYGEGWAFVRDPDGGMWSCACEFCGTVIRWSADREFYKRRHDHVNRCAVEWWTSLPPRDPS